MFKGGYRAYDRKNCQRVIRDKKRRLDATFWCENRKWDEIKEKKL